jgi:putative heme-binding domain-containing protein
MFWIGLIVLFCYAVSPQAFAQTVSVFQGAPPPGKPFKDSPLTAEDQQKTFTLPPGFQIELVAAEPDGGKFVTIAFDHAGRLWTMTAFDYPLDANEAPAEAKALFARGGRDRVLVFDTPTALERQKPRTFAEGLAIPLGLLPYRTGAFVQYGGEIRFYRDTDHDGRADQAEAVLSGFGIEDSHLFPHQFTRAPGGWILMAQGAFNYSKVRTKIGNVTDYNKTKLARFTPDGQRFDIIGWGPCNIWGLVIDRLGEVFIQEANDQGWPMMPFLEGGSYPLCGDDLPRPYAPPFPKLAEREMGGTGLSGLAFSEGADSFPGPWRDVFFIANPITGKIQAIRCHRNPNSSRLEEPQTSGQKNQSLATPAANNFGNGWRLEHLPDFLQCADPWFRPVAIQFGPDGCLYIVDWYNKIISHNEVPRNHPERDKIRGRIWRVRHESQPRRLKLPNLYQASERELLVHLAAADTWEVNAAWQEIVDRQAASLAPNLTTLLTDEAQPNDLRLRALWCLEGLRQAGLKHLETLARAKHRALRKEALRVLREAPAPRVQEEDALRLGERGLADSDRLVRQEAIRLLGDLLEPARGPAVHAPKVVALLAHAATTARAGDWPRFPNFFRDFERYLIRRELENHPPLVSQFLSSRSVSAEPQAFAALALGGTNGANRLAAALSKLQRAPTSEELLLVASAPNEPAANAVLKAALANPANLRLLYEQRSRLTEHSQLRPILAEAARALTRADASEGNQDLLVKLAAGFRLVGLENEVAAAATGPGASTERRLAAIRALREAGSIRVDVFRQFVTGPSEVLRREAITALASAKSDAAVPVLLEVWPFLSPALRKTAMDRLANSAGSARALVAAISSGAITRDELDAYTLEKLAVVLPADALVQQLGQELGPTFQPILRLNGGNDDWVDTDLTLEGPFTVECWARLDPDLSNADSLLAGAGAFDANFHDSRFRIFIANGPGDIVIAKKSMAPESWTHVAFTRDSEGRFRVYLNGELDNTSGSTELRKFQHLTVGLSLAPGGTAGEIAEFRVWTICRTPNEIRAAMNLAWDSDRRRESKLNQGSSGTSRSLLYHGTGESWGKLHGNARIERTGDLPPLQTEAEASALETKFALFRSLANRPGDIPRGRQVFDASCGLCHSVHGQGGKIGPVLDGAGASDVEGLLRNILTPNAAMEAGYRRFRVETRDGDVQEGLLVSQDENTILLRQPNSEDLRIQRAKIKRAAFTRISLMPEGLLEAMKPAEVADLLAYLRTLK